MLKTNTQPVTSEVFPLGFADDVGRIADRAVETLGLTESWRAVEDSGVVEPAELTWPGGTDISEHPPRLKPAHGSSRNIPED